MDERSFWSLMEYRLGDEIAAAYPDRASQAWWCDGFALDHADSLEMRVWAQSGLAGDATERDYSSMEGTVWMCRGSSQEPWTLRVTVAGLVNPAEYPDWQRLIPPADKHGWLHIDWIEKAVTIGLSAQAR